MSASSEVEAALASRPLLAASRQITASGCTTLNRFLSTLTEQRLSMLPFSMRSWPWTWTRGG